MSNIITCIIKWCESYKIKWWSYWINLIFNHKIEILSKKSCFNANVDYIIIYLELYCVPYYQNLLFYSYNF